MSISFFLLFLAMICFIDYCEVLYHRIYKDQVKQKTKTDTRLPQLRAGGQGPYLGLLEHLGRSSEAKDRKNIKREDVTD